MTFMIPATMSKGDLIPTLDREGWRQVDDEKIIKPADHTGPALEVSGRTWVKDDLSLCIVVYEAELAHGFAEMVKAETGHDVAGFTTPLCALVHRATRYPIARFAMIDQAAQMAELAEACGFDWSSFELPKGPATIKDPVYRVAETWVAAGVRNVINPAAGCECLVIFPDNVPASVN